MNNTDPINESQIILFLEEKGFVMKDRPDKLDIRFRKNSNSYYCDFSIYYSTLPCVYFKRLDLNLLVKKTISFTTSMKRQINLSLFLFDELLDFLSEDFGYYVFFEAETNIIECYNSIDSKVTRISRDKGVETNDYDFTIKHNSTG